MLTRLTVQNVRNLAPQSIDLAGAGLVVVTGANAQGKTSILEAAYLLATTRSFRTRDPREAIAAGQDHLRVEGTLEGPDGPLPGLAMALGKARGERVLSVGQFDAKLAEYLGLLPALPLAGDSIRQVAGSPSERRRFVDRATAAADAAHLADLSDYRRALNQRNEALRRGAGDRELDPWDDLLAGIGGKIASRRRAQIAAWQAELASWPDLFPEGARARLVYREAGRSKGGTLRERLERQRPLDRQTLRTSAGPHRDDLLIELDGADLLKLGSAGQVRSALAAVTAAQVRRVRLARTGRKPLLLLDDVDTDLDPRRLAALLEAAAAEAQVLAATSKAGLGVPAGALRLAVAAGKVAALD